jgi:hypothetical protein
VQAHVSVARELLPGAAEQLEPRAAAALVSAVAGAVGSGGELGRSTQLCQLMLSLLDALGAGAQQAGGGGGVEGDAAVLVRRLAAAAGACKTFLVKAVQAKAAALLVGGT